MLRLACDLDKATPKKTWESCKNVLELRQRLLPVARGNVREVVRRAELAQRIVRERQSRDHLADLTLVQLKLVAVRLPEITVSGSTREDYINAIAPVFGKRWFHLRAVLGDQAGLEDWLQNLQ